MLSSKTYFITLSAAATALLWGVSVWNGTVKELIRTTWYGRFEDGSSFKTNYTGIYLLDFPLSLLVAFFFFGTNGSDKGYQHFLIDAYSTLQSAFIWLYIESSRSSEKPKSVSYPIIWGIFWQCFGAAISLPLFYYHHIDWISSQPIGLSSVSLPNVQALPLSFSIGALLPAIVGMLPTWFDRSSLTHQNILAIWQPDPVWVSGIQAATVSILRRRASNIGTRKNLGNSVSWVRFSYLLAAVSSATGHIYVLLAVLFSNDPSMSFSRMYIPHWFTGPTGANLKLISGPWLFLQYDLIIIALSSLSWVYILVNRLQRNNSILNANLMVALFVGGIAIGPGATVSLALFWREGELERLRSTPRRSALKQSRA